MRKVDIIASAAALAAAKPLTLPTRFSEPLTYLNANAVDALTTAIAVKLNRKCSLADVTFYEQVDIVPVSYLESYTYREYKNHTGTSSLQDSSLPKNNKHNVIQADDICLVQRGGVADDTVVNVMRGIIDANDKKS